MAPFIRTNTRCHVGDVNNTLKGASQAANRVGGSARATIVASSAVQDCTGNPPVGKSIQALGKMRKVELRSNSHTGNDESG
jgi:hypothetical protein